MRSYAAAGELLLADGTTYTRLATYDAPDMEAALRRAAETVERWRVEQIAARPHATVRDIIEVQISDDPTASSRQSGGTQDQQEGEQRQEEPPRFPHEQGGALLVGMIARGGKVVRSSVHAHSPFDTMLIIRVLINRRRCGVKSPP
jgi:hypothetical protein